MKKIFLTMIAVAAFAATSFAQCVYPTDNVTINFKRKDPNLIDGDFSVAEKLGGGCRKVHFAAGNLQYQASTGTWRIAAKQYTYIGNNAGNNVTTDRDVQAAWIDCFGWGTAGNSEAAGEYQPYATSTSIDIPNPYVQYLNSAGEWDPNKSDWGVVNDSKLGSYDWRVLTRAEWIYLFDTREPGNSVNGTSNARYTEAKILTDGTGTDGLTYNICGVIIFPDDANLTTVAGVTWGTINGTSDWGTTCTTAGWTALENAGCVFLPAAGYRNGTSVNYAGTRGYYWSSTAENGVSSHYLRFFSNEVMLNVSYRYFGSSVRLVQDVE